MEQVATQFKTEQSWQDERLEPQGQVMEPQQVIIRNLKVEPPDTEELQEAIAETELIMKQEPPDEKPEMKHEWDLDEMEHTIEKPELVIMIDVLKEKIDDNDTLRGTSRSYTEDDIESAMNKVSEGLSVYKAAMEFRIPYSTLKHRVFAVSKKKESKIKKRRTCNLTVKEESKLLSYIRNMQSLGFFLSITEIRQYAFNLAKQSNRKRNCFNEEKGTAGWGWWMSFKKRYGSTFKLLNGKAIPKVSATRDKVAMFYNSVQMVFNKHGIANRPRLMWNMLKGDLSYVISPAKMVSTPTGGHQQMPPEIETVNIIITANASGFSGPCLITFKGHKDTNDLQNYAPEESKVEMSENGEITKEIFFEFLQHFVNCIPNERPILLLMNSQRNHISHEALKFTNDNNLIWFTFPYLTTHILQPLDVSVFGSLKQNLSEKIKEHVTSKGLKPTRMMFLSLFTLVFKEFVSKQNVVNGFRRTGMFPLDKGAVYRNTLQLLGYHYVTKTDEESRPTTDMVPTSTQEENIIKEKKQIFEEPQTDSAPFLDDPV